MEGEQQMDAPLVQWKNKPQSITVTTWGSSSCPPDATDLELGAENNLTIYFESETEGACTADLAPTTHVFTLPDDAQHSPLTVRINSDGVTSPDRHVLD